MEGGEGSIRHREKENIPCHKKNIGNQEIEDLFIPLKKINCWEKEFLEFLQELVQHIHKLIKKQRVENEYIDTKVGKLSARELLSEGKTFYMNPCLDFVLVTIEGLKRIGIEEIKLVVDELQCSWGFYRIHFGIEIKKEEVYYIDYRTKNDVFLGKGEFKSNYIEKGENVVNSIKVEAGNISTDDNIYNLIERGLCKFKKFNLQILDLIKEKWKSDNSPEERKNWFADKVKDIYTPEIYIKHNTLETQPII